MEAEIGGDKVAGLSRQIVTGPADVAGVLAALEDPVPSRFLRERGAPVIVPLGKSLFLDAARDWSGEFDFGDRGAIVLAKAYASGGRSDG